jgi:hypothetical protein
VDVYGMRHVVRVYLQIFITVGTVLYPDALFHL